jgi:hypothetical protein
MFYNADFWLFLLSQHKLHPIKQYFYNLSVNYQQAYRKYDSILEDKLRRE